MPVVSRGRKQLQRLNERGDARGLQVFYHPSSVALARHAIVEDLRLVLDEATCTEAELVVSELLGNAMRHARPIDRSVRLRWQVRETTVDIEVTDGGPKNPKTDRGVRPLRPTEQHTHGRGLRIVRSIAHEWGTHEDEQGHRTVWAAVGGPSKRRRRTP